MTTGNESRSVLNRTQETHFGEMKLFNSQSKAATENIKKLQETVTSLKTEIHDVAARMEQSFELLKRKITSKITLVLNLLSEKQTHIKATLDNCYRIISSLTEIFLNIGYEFEKDINMICLKVNDFDEDIKHMTNQNRIKVLDCGIPVLWFINSDGKLTVRKNIVVSSVLPKFKCGDRKTRRKFVAYLNEVFSTSEVPSHLWVTLASNQLTGMAQDWWNMHDSGMTWQEFCQHFIDWTFNDGMLGKKLKVEAPIEDKTQNENESKDSSPNETPKHFTETYNNKNNHHHHHHHQYYGRKRTSQTQTNIDSSEFRQESLVGDSRSKLSNNGGNVAIEFQSLLNETAVKEADRAESSESGKETASETSEESSCPASFRRKRKYPFTVLNDDTKMPKVDINNTSKFQNNHHTIPKSQYKLRTRKK